MNKYYLNKNCQKGKKLEKLSKPLRSDLIFVYSKAIWIIK